MNTQTQIPSYQKNLEELRSNLTTMLPKDALQVFDNDAQQLEKEHQSILQLQKGDKAPDFSLSNAMGNTIKLSELLKKGRVVLTFYRGAWCPYCSLQLNLYQQILPEIKKLGAQLVAISPQTPDHSLDMLEKNALKFEVLSDNGNIVAKQYTTVFKSAKEPIDTMSKLGFDFSSYYSDDSAELPIPAVFIIEQDFEVSFAKAVGGDYRNRVEVSEIIQSLKQ